MQVQKPLLETEGSLENLSVPTILPSSCGCRLVVFIYAFLEAAGPTKLIIVSDFFSCSTSQQRSKTAVHHFPTGQRNSYRFCSRWQLSGGISVNKSIPAPWPWRHPCSNMNLLDLGWGRKEKFYILMASALYRVFCPFMDVISNSLFLDINPKK